MHDRRQFLKQCAVAASASALSNRVFAAEPNTDASAPPRPSTKLVRRRWHMAFGLNGFESSENSFGNSFPIWEVLDFAQREGFEGIELVPNWPHKGMYVQPGDDDRIASLKGLFDRYHLKTFSIQTFGQEAFQASRTTRDAWVKRFASLAQFAGKIGCDSMGYWPMGDIGGQTVEEAIESLVYSLRRMGTIVADQNLTLGVEIEPPFAFNKPEHLLRILDATDHPRVKAIYDPSHFDVMTGSRGKPHELVERIGVRRIAYIQFTDSDGTLFHGTSRHLPCGQGHIDICASLDTLWCGGFEGWFMIDAWDTKNPYEACRKARLAIDAWAKATAGSTR